MSSATRIRVGTRYVLLVTEDRLELTDDPEAAAWFTWGGSVDAERLVRRHLEDLDPEAPLP